jgi:hypothetical protein
MIRMRRHFLLAALALVTIGIALAPAATNGQSINLGAQTGTPLIAPTCPKGVAPADCNIILERVTALATIRDGTSYPTKATKSGRIVAFSVGLSRLSAKKSVRQQDINFLNNKYGGDAQVAIAVLKHVGKGGQKWQVVQESSFFHVVRFLGSVAQIPLVNSLAIKPGEVVALTTPTWAPVLSIDVPKKKFAYRQSRSGTTKQCGLAGGNNRAQKVGQTTNYQCRYPGTRPEYAATEITYPVASNPVH